MSNSNQIIRNRTIGKAVFLTILPMIFSGLGVYLTLSTSTVNNEIYKDKYEKINIEYSLLKKQDSLQIGTLSEINRNWNKYHEEHQNFIMNNDSSSVEKLKLRIEEAGKTLLRTFNAEERKVSDSIYLVILNSLGERFDKYCSVMKDSREFKEQLDRLGTGQSCCIEVDGYLENIGDLENNIVQSRNALDACNQLKAIKAEQLNSCGRRNAELERQKSELESQKSELEKSLGIKHRSQVKIALSNTGIINNNKKKLLDLLPFGRE